MSTNLTTSHPEEVTTHAGEDTARRPARRRHVALIAVGAAALVASAGGIAFARGGDDPASDLTPSVRTQLTCAQLAQLGPAANNAMSDAALASWRQQWTEARC